MRHGTTSGLAAALEGWDDDRLAALLLARPDLAHPAPTHLASLAARAAGPHSARAALRHVTQHDLDEARTGRTTPHLLDLALAWDEDGPAFAPALAEVAVGSESGPPQPVDAPVTPTDDAAAGLAAAQAVALVDELLWRIDQAPPRVLRTGGLPVADLRALARALDLDLGGSTTAAALAICCAAGLLAVGGEDDTLWLPTPDADEWRTAPVAHRWQVLAAAWLSMPDVPHLVGHPRERAAGTIAALSVETCRPALAAWRRLVLDELATLDGGISLEHLLDRLAWRHACLVAPRDVVESIVAEATWLGLLAPGPSAAARDLLGANASRGDFTAGSRLVLPAPADRVVLGSDLTAMLPGIPDGPLADLLRACADIESRGGATLYRFSAASLDRALDSGWTVAAIRERLAPFGIPHVLDVALTDAGTRHAALVVGGVSSYLRCDDPATLAELSRTPRLGLRVVAPTVAVSTLGPSVLLARLRAAGRVPAVAGADGEVHAIGSAPLRARRPRSTPVEGLDAAAVRALAQRIRLAPRHGGEPGLVRALLAEAAARGARVEVEHVDAAGRSVRTAVVVSAVEGGWLRGEVDGRTHVIALARITHVRASSPS